ncbi:MAG: hypothetical protein NVS4B3_01260 [Gemmatimonadaceae bacterium]
MKKVSLLLGASLITATACTDSARTPTDPTLAASRDASNPSDLQDVREPHVHLRRGYARGGKNGSPLMTWHNGSILVTNTTTAIFWGTEWTSSTFPGDKITGLDSFFSGFGGSGYAKTSTEYTGLPGQQVTDISTYRGHVIDNTAAPSGAISVSTAVAEACKVSNNSPDANGLYLIYTSTGAGNVNYCAWHSYGSCGNGAPVQVAYMPNLDGVAGCDPTDTYTTHSPGLAALANVTAHELSETITDPRNGGWYDAGGAENGDKCAWAFHNVVTLSNGSIWKLQMEWSNNAYTYSTGYPNLNGQLGCLQG